MDESEELHPVFNVVYEVKEVDENKVKLEAYKVKTIMAYDLVENKDSYRKVAEQIVDSYNKEHTISVFGEEKEPPFNYSGYIADELVITGYEKWDKQPPIVGKNRRKI